MAASLMVAGWAAGDGPACRDRMLASNRRAAGRERSPERIGRVDDHRWRAVEVYWFRQPATSAKRTSNLLSSQPAVACPVPERSVLARWRPYSLLGRAVPGRCGRRLCARARHRRADGISQDRTAKRPPRVARNAAETKFAR